MRDKIWMIRTGDPAAEQRLVAAGIPPISAKVLSARKIRTPELARCLLSTSLEAVGDPYRLPDMAAAVERLTAALAAGEKIAVHGDYDVDGITSTAMVCEWLREKGADCVTYIPVRREDSFGLTPQGVERLAAEGVSLILTVDCGATAREAACRAGELGVDMIITDHHEAVGALPRAAAVVKPQREAPESPDRLLAGVGVAFMLMLAVEGADKLEELARRWGDLVAIGTIADVVPMTGANRSLCARGIEQVRAMERTGLRALIAETKLSCGRINSTSIGFTLAPRLNAAGRMGSAADAVELLLTKDMRQAEQLARRLCELNRERQKTENDLLEVAGAAAEQELRRLGSDYEGALVLCGEGWYQGVAGIVASRLSERYARPVFVICIEPETGLGKGSVRSFYGVDILGIMRRLSYLFEGWGGHECAAGFTIRTEQLPLLRESVEDLAFELSSPHLHVDAVLDPAELTPEFVEGLGMLGPFGVGNEFPLFILRDAEIDSYVPVGWGRSARMSVLCGGREFPAFSFGSDPSAVELCDGDRGDVLCTLTLEERRGEKRAALVVKGLRPSPEEYRRYIGETALFYSFKNGERLSREQAAMLLPGRGDFLGVMRYIRRNRTENHRLTTSIFAMCRRICRAEQLELGYGRLMVALEALADVNKVEYFNDGINLNIEHISDEPADLSASPTMKKLRGMLDAG